MKKTTNLLILTGLTVFAFFGCKSAELIKLEQANKQKVAVLEYNLINTDNEQEKLNNAYQILDIDYQNKLANSLLLDYSKNPKFQNEILEKFYQLAEKNIDDQQAFWTAKDCLMYIPQKPQIAKLSLLIEKFFSEKIANGKFNAELFQNNTNIIFYHLPESVAHNKLEYVENFINNIEKIYPTLTRNEQIFFDLDAMGLFDLMSRRATPPKKFWHKNKIKHYQEKRNFYFDRVIKQRKEYFNAESTLDLINELLTIGEFDAALNVADDYKDIEGIDELDKLLTRIHVISISGNHHKAFDLLKLLEKENFDKVALSLIIEAQKTGNYEYALNVAEKLYKNDKTFSNTAIYSTSLLKNDKIDEVDKLIEDNKDDELLYLSLKMDKEIFLRKFSPDLHKVLAATIKDDKLFTEKYQEFETQTFIHELLNYLMFTKNNELLHNLANKLKTTKLFYSEEIMLNSLGYTMLECDLNLKEAGELITQAYLLNPLNINSLDSIAWYNFKTGNYKEAKKYIDYTLCNPNYMSNTTSAGIIYLHAGDIYRACGNEAKAIEFYEKAANCQEDALFKYDDLKKRFAK